MFPCPPSPKKCASPAAATARASPRRARAFERDRDEARATTVMGAQSRTGKARAKRDGVPLDAKTRKKLAAAESAKRPGITYAQKRKAQRAARDAKKRSGDSGRASNDGEMRRETPQYGPLEVRYRALAKKLRQIEALEAREREGEGMDAQQVKKLRRKEYLEAEMRNLKKLISGEEEEEESEDDDEDEEEDTSEEDDEEDEEESEEEEDEDDEDEEESEEESDEEEDESEEESDEEE